jgi:hypothetical protein
MERDVNLDSEHLANLIGDASIRGINHLENHKDTDGKWKVTPIRRGQGFASWFLKDKTLKRTKADMYRMASSASLAALFSQKIPLLIHFDRPYVDILRDVKTLLSQNLRQREDRDDIVQQACDMMDQGLLYFQSENMFYQTLDLHGRLVLRPIKKDPHSFGVNGISIPKPKLVQNKRTGAVETKWKEEKFYDIYLAHNHVRYSFFEWSPEALNPHYDLKKLGTNFNAFSGFVRDAAYFKKCWEDASPQVKERVGIIRNWVRKGICGGQVPYKTNTYEYIRITKGYLEFLEKLIKNMIMYPWNRSGVFVVMHGDQGTGKGVLVNTLANRIYGAGSPLFRSVTKAEHVFGHYSLDGENECLMMFFDETEINRQEHINSLKNATTEGVRNANYKFKAQAPVQTWWQGFLATNSPTPVLIKGNERRIFVVCTKLIKGGGVFPRWVSELIQNPTYFDAWLGKICSSYPEVNDKWHAQSDRPQTYAYHNLKVRSFSPVSAWWLECMRKGYYSEEPKTDDKYYYGNHQFNPVWKNNRPNNLWNDLISQKWLFEAYYKEAKDFVSLRSFNKNNQDDPVIKFLSEIIPLIYGPKFNLTKVPKDDKGLMIIPTLKECVINFCKYHFIYDVGMLHIPSIPHLELKHKTEEEMMNEDDIWKVMKKLVSIYPNRLIPPRPTPIDARQLPPRALPPPPPPPTSTPSSPSPEPAHQPQNMEVDGEEGGSQDSNYEIENYEEDHGSNISDAEDDEDDDMELGPTPPPTTTTATTATHNKKRRKWAEDDDYEAWRDQLNGQNLGDVFSVTEENEREKGKEISVSKQNPFMLD